MSKNNRKLTSQIEKLKEVFSDILDEIQLLEIEGAAFNVKKGVNILEEMEKDNENRRANE